MSLVEPPLPTPGFSSRRTRGCLIAALIAIPLAMMLTCCGGLYFAQHQWGTHQFRGGLRITADARRAYAEASQANADHFLCVEDTGAQYRTTYTPRLPRDEYVTFEERGVKVVVERSICNSPEWRVLRPIIVHRGEKVTENYGFGFLDADPPSGFPRVGR
jgi:hypothetical protein